MTKHNRPVDKTKPAAKKKRPPKKVNGSGSQPSRTAMNPAGAWPFPPGGKK